MGRFNVYLWGFICCLPLGLTLLLSGVMISTATLSGMSLLVLGIGVLAIAGILFIVGLIKLGQQTV
ncbi:MAG: hypothetical protein HWN65_10875 [Candidatus Helarchaeota archaeon]|nr:hypothetical protein [Candidatus Helarchaeota archaeon]